MSTDEASEAPEIQEMFVQVAHGATRADNQLILEAVAPSTLYFADRPDRVVGHLSTRSFVDRWSEGQDELCNGPAQCRTGVPGARRWRARGRRGRVARPDVRRQLAQVLDRGAGRLGAGIRRSMLSLHRPDRPAAVADVDCRRQATRRAARIRTLGGAPESHCLSAGTRGRRGPHRPSSDSLRG